MSVRLPHAPTNISWLAENGQISRTPHSFIASFFSTPMMGQALRCSGHGGPKQWSRAVGKVGGGSAEVCRFYSLDVVCGWYDIKY